MLKLYLYSLLILFAWLGIVSIIDSNPLTMLLGMFFVIDLLIILWIHLSEFFKESVNVSIQVFSKELILSKGINALNALQELERIEIEKTHVGSFVKGIEGIKSRGNNYLKLYINGEEASKGIEEYTLNKDTLIQLKLEEIKENKQSTLPLALENENKINKSFS